MIKYITKEEFFDLIEDLKNTKKLILEVECAYDGEVYDWQFAYVDFYGGTYLYTPGYPDVGVIQDTQVSTFEEQLEEIWNELIGEDGDDKPFIEIDDEPDSESS